MDLPLTHFYYQSIFSTPELGCDFHWWNQNRTCLHMHMDYYEFCLITRGELKYVYNGQEMTVHSGDLLFNRPGDHHVFWAPNPADNGYENDVQQVNISLTEDVMEDVLRLCAPSVRQRLCRGECAVSFLAGDAFEALMTLLQNTVLQAESDEDYAAAIKYWALTAMHKMMQCEIRVDLSAVARVPDWFSALLSEMNQAQNLSLRLAQLPSYREHSPTTVSKLFARCFGTTPNGYLLEIRLRYACRLLRSTDFGMLKITQMIGFDSLSHFNHVFKERIGMTPGAYRRSFFVQ